MPVLRARNFLNHCQKKNLYLGDDELIVGERGPAPKVVPTFPELTCHSVEDFNVLNCREQQRYTISEEDIATYAREVIPYWQGKTIRELEAESVAYVVARHFGMQDLASPNYVALHGADAALILAHMEHIRITAAEIIASVKLPEAVLIPA